MFMILKIAESIQKKLQCDILEIKPILLSHAYILKRGVCMIIDEYKSDSTIIRIEDRDIGTKEKSKEIIDILLSLTIKKISEYSGNDL